MAMDALGGADRWKRLSSLPQRFGTNMLIYATTVWIFPNKNV
jgi:hypothetical protein